MRKVYYPTLFADMLRGLPGGGTAGDELVEKESDEIEAFPRLHLLADQHQIRILLPQAECRIDLVVIGDEDAVEMVRAGCAQVVARSGQAVEGEPGMRVHVHTEAWRILWKAHRCWSARVRIRSQASRATMTAPAVNVATAGALITHWYASSDDNDHGAPSSGETLAFGGAGYHTVTGVDHGSSMSFRVASAAGSVGSASMTQRLNAADPWTAVTLVFRAGVAGPVNQPPVATDQALSLLLDKFPDLQADTTLASLTDKLSGIVSAPHLAELLSSYSYADTNPADGG